MDLDKVDPVDLQQYRQDRDEARERAAVIQRLHPQQARAKRAIAGAILHGACAPFWLDQGANGDAMLAILRRALVDRPHMIGFWQAWRGIVDKWAWDHVNEIVSDTPTDMIESTLAALAIGFEQQISNAREWEVR